MNNQVNINGQIYFTNVSAARVTEKGMAKLNPMNGATLPYGTKLYLKEEPSLAQLTALCRTLVAMGADPEYIKSLVAFAVAPINWGSALETEAATPDKAT